MSLAAAIGGRRAVFFCGKGGVGKTTLAAASALALGAGGVRCLLLGTDPAAALPRVLGVEVAVETEIAGGVRARQIGADALLERFRAEHGATIAAIIEGGTYLAKDDAEALCARSLPGIDEVLSLLELAEAVEAPAREEETPSRPSRLKAPAREEETPSRPSRLKAPAREEETPSRPSRLKAPGAPLVLVDTAPSAHALRLLSLPEMFEAALAVLGAMRDKARAIEEALGGHPLEAATDRLLASLGGRVKALRALLADAGASGFVAVVLPEASAVAEARRLADELRSVGLAPVAVIVNALEANEEACCERGARRQERARAAVEEARRRFEGVPLLELGREAEAPIGIEPLRKLGEKLLSAESDQRPLRKPGREETRRDDSGSSIDDRSRSENSWIPMFLDSSEGPSDKSSASRRLFLMGGKGGVGKTTIAAALALALATRKPPRRVLLASIGGAGGLSRALASTLGDDPREIEGFPGLLAAEVDARARFERLKAGFREDVEHALDKLIGGGPLDLTYDRAIVRSLLDLAPPGIDEIAGLAFLLESAGAYDEVILDCAPTGHLVRFLEMPRLARDWLALALRLLGKYPEGFSSAGAVERTVSLLRRVREAALLLSDPARTALVLVSLPERIPAEETAGLSERAGERGVAVTLAIVNRVTPATACARCERRRASEVEVASNIARALAPAPVVTLDESDDEPLGAARLRALSLRRLPASPA